jgi:hypothetical protein
MLEKAFWTEKRLDALSRLSLTLFQAFIIAGILGGVFYKITSAGLKLIFIGITIGLFIMGMIFADPLLNQEK